MRWDWLSRVTSSELGDRALRFFAGSSAGAKHALRIEFHRDLALGVYRDDPALAPQGGEFLEPDFAPRRAQGAAAEAHPRTNIVRHRGANEYFPMSCSRHGAGAVIRVGARADDGRIADTFLALSGHAPRGGCRCQPAGAVQRDRAHRTHVGYGQRGQPGVAAADAFELAPALRGVEVATRYQCDAAGQGEFLRSRAAQHDVFGMLHDGARQFDRVPDMGHAAYRAGLETASVHDRGIQFVAAVESEHRTQPGIEQWIVLEPRYGACHGVPP